MGQGGGRRADREPGAGAEPEVDGDGVALQEPGGGPNEHQFRPGRRVEDLGRNGGPGFQQHDPIPLDDGPDPAVHRALRK